MSELGSKFANGSLTRTMNSSDIYLGSWVRRLEMNSIAVVEISWNISLGNSSWHRVMLQKVSCFVSPPKGVQPVSNTYARTPTDLYVFKIKLINFSASPSIMPVRQRPLKYKS